MIHLAALGCCVFLQGQHVPMGLIRRSSLSMPICRYANSQGCSLAESQLLAALRSCGSKLNQHKCGACVRWLLAHRCPMPQMLDSMDLYIVGVKQQMLKERRTATMAVLRHSALSRLPSLPLACCELILQSADLWIPAVTEPPHTSAPKLQESEAH